LTAGGVARSSTARRHGISIATTQALGSLSLGWRRCACYARIAHRAASCRVLIARFGVSLRCSRHSQKQRNRGSVSIVGIAL